MPGPAKVIIVDADPAANAALRFGLSRAGLVVDTVATTADAARAAGNVGLILVADDKDGVATVAAIRDELDAAALLTPILFIGGAERRALEKAGASEVLAGPPALRDIANVARVMLGDRRPEGWGGTLAEVTGVFGLVRALSALGRSGVLTLTRGVRRGEVRYYHGEITSAQVGMIHGQAAFHQLLLWTDAKFDFRQELVVRRRQIPLSPEELIADAEQFLESTRDIAGGLSPSVVLDVVSDRVAALAIKIPTEVHGILNMFDGRRTLVDILEDSPYRVHETLRVARKGFESKVLRAVPSTRPKPTWKAVLSLEEWLLGAQPMVPRPARLPGEMAASAAGASGAIAEPMHDARTVKYGENGMQARRDPGPLEWADLVPRTSGLEMPMLSPIVPATKASGEVEREFGDGAGPQPALTRSVIVSEDAIISPEERAEEERLIAERQRAEREAIAKEIEAAAKEAAAKEAAAKEAAEKAEAAAKEAAAKEAAAKEAAAKAEAEAAAKEAAAKAAAEAAAKEAADKEAAAKEAAAKEAAAKEAAAKEAAAKEAAKEAAAKETAAKEAAAKEAAAKEAAAKEAAAKEAAAAREAAAKETEARQAERARLLAEEEERLENEKTTKIDRRASTASEASDTSGKGGKKRKKDRHKAAPVAGVPVVASPAALAVTVKADAAKPEAISGNAAPAGDVKESVKSEVATEVKASPAKHARAASAPLEGEPAVLVADLKAAHDAASAVAKAQAKAPATPDVGAAHGKVVDQVKNDASKATAAFTADEEAFFQKDHAAVDSFADLDVGYRRPTFWQRLLGKTKPTS